MHDAETQTTQAHGTAVTHSSTTRISLLKRIGARKLTRAHLALQARPAFCADATTAIQEVGAALSTHLSTEVVLDAEVIESTINPFGGLSRFAVFALIELGPLGQRAVLEVDLAALNDLLGRVAGSAPRPAAPITLTRIEEAAFGWVCLEALSVLRHHPNVFSRFGARLLSVHSDRGEVLERVDCRLKHLGIDVFFSCGDVRGRGRVLLPALSVTTALQNVASSLPSNVSDELLEAAIFVHPRVGHAVLVGDDLATLSPGDVVMFDQLHSVGSELRGRARLRNPCFELAGEFTSEGFRFTALETRTLSPLHQESPMNSPENTNTQPSLPIEVEVELTRITVPVRELATIKPGAVIPLRISASEPVTLRIGDRAVARAELVEIEGEVGARVIGLLK